jgi:hypothetical protein
MKYVFLILILCAANQTKAQKYILLDQAISQPAFYSNQITVSEKYKGFFPVEKKDLPKFLKALEEISARLTSNKTEGKAKNYTIGCTQFTGTVFPLSKGERLDYILTSTCDGVNVSMHLVNAKLSNDDNAYFVSTWIKYIKNAMKQK